MISPDRGDPLLLLDRLSVNVEGRAALTGVTLSVMRGEIHAVVGGQGAGKSTLVKVIAGLIPKTGGRFLFDGRAVEKHSPGNALRLGILTVHQEPGLLPGLSAVEFYGTQANPNPTQTCVSSNVTSPGTTSTAAVLTVMVPP